MSGKLIFSACLILMLGIINIAVALGPATDPYPLDGAMFSDTWVVLTWLPGDSAVSHDVYFGADYDAVVLADTADPTGVYRGRTEVNSHDLGALELERTYYWRIDEINPASPDSPWRGDVWSFTTAGYILVDDFERYDAGDNQIWYSWHDGLSHGTPDAPPYYAGNNTGAVIGEPTTGSYTEETIVHGGSQSMPYFYDNNKQGYSKYSQAEKTLIYPRDWTDGGAKALSLWFYGDLNNDPEPMYVTVADSTGALAILYHDNPNITQVDAWVEWYIDLQDFAEQGVNLTYVNEIAIGFGTNGNMTIPGGRGTIYFDDIRLCRTICGSAGVPKLGWISFDADAEPGEGPRSCMKDETTMGMMLNFDVPGMFVQEVEVEGVTYHRLSIPGHATLLDEGKPELPVLGQTIEVPYGVSFDIEIVKSRSIPLQCYNVYPAQEREIRLGEPEVKKLALDKATYLTDANYPGELAVVEAEDIAVIRGHRVVFLKVNPIQYNPVTKETVAFSNIELRLKYDRPALIQGIDERIESPAFEEMLKSLLLNYKSPGRMTSLLSTGEWSEGCDYLIITHSEFYNKNDPQNPVVRLRDWKQSKGLKTMVVDIVDIGSGTATDIQDFIQLAYNTWKPAPTYVLLVGDAGDDTGKVLIPTNYKTEHIEAFHYGTKIATDLYYATVDGADYFPDIYIGRLPVDTQQEAKIVIDKILNYERKPPANNPGFYKNVPLVGFFEDGKPANGQEDEFFIFIEVLEEIFGFLKNKGYNPERIYTTNCTHKDGPKKYANGTDLPSYIQKPSFLWNGSAQHITNAIDTGGFILTYLGHGWRGGFTSPIFGEFFDSGHHHVAGLKNEALIPVVFSYGCGNSWFDNETDNDGPIPSKWKTDNNIECFNEYVLRHDKGGGVATIGSSRAGYNVAYLALGVYEALWPDFKPNPPISPDPGSTGKLPNVTMGPLVRMGQITTFSKVYMANYIYHDAKGYRKMDFEVFHLFGDPEMPVWTKQPKDLDVLCPDGIGSTGKQDFVVKVKDDASKQPVQSAVVVMIQGDKIISFLQTDFGGIARFTLNSPASGKLNLTVTAHNYIPYEKEIIVSASGAEINLINPPDGKPGSDVYVGGIYFVPNDQVTISFDGVDKVTSQTDGSGSFGQVSAADVKFGVPDPYPLGPANVLARDKSGRYAVDVFRVRSDKPVYLYTYCQTDSSTWGQGDHPIWNSPDIQLYDDSNNQPVESDNLDITKSYTIKVNIYNDYDNIAESVRVTFKWAPFGSGQSVWTDIKTISLDVRKKGMDVVELSGWMPPKTGHVCVIAEIYHVEDVETSDNIGQENCHVGTSSSPAQVSFLVCNPTDRPARVHLELRQLMHFGLEEEEILWPSWIRHPDPQLIPPGDCREACAIIDPPADVRPGQQAEFALTAFIDRQVIGGVNFIITKK